MCWAAIGTWFSSLGAGSTAAAGTTAAGAGAAGTAGAIGKAVLSSALSAAAAKAVTPDAKAPKLDAMPKQSTEQDIVGTTDEAKKRDKLRRGLASTIKTSQHGDISGVNSLKPSLRGLKTLLGT